MDRFKVLGAYVLLSVIANVGNNAYAFTDWLEILWFCNWIAVFLGIGLLLKNRDLISTTLVLCVPAQFLWIADFFLQMLGIGLGRTAFLHEYGWVDFALSLNLHAILIPISAYASARLGFSRRSLPLAWLAVLILLPSTFAFTYVEDNINCVFYPCDLKEPPHGVFRQGYVSYFWLHSVGYWLGVMTMSGLAFRWIFGANSQGGFVDGDARLIDRVFGLSKSRKDGLDDASSIARPTAAIEGDDEAGELGVGMEGKMGLGKDKDRGESLR